MPTMNGLAHSPKPASAFMKCPICSTVLFRQGNESAGGFYLDDNAYYFEIVEDGKTVTVENEPERALSMRRRSAL